MLIRLRHRGRPIELRPGEFSIGRAPECHLVLDDRNVSRRHAVVSVRPEGAAIRDAGSRHGVLVNEVRLTGSRELRDLDCIVIGNQRLYVSMGGGEPSTRDEPITRKVTPPETPVEAAGDATPPPIEPTEPSRPSPVESLEAAAGLADKFLATGRPADAQWVLTRGLGKLLDAAHTGRPLDPEQRTLASYAATRLAVATGRGAWVDYVIHLHLVGGGLIPGHVVDALYELVRTVRIDLPMLRAYLRMLREEAASFGPAEREELHRIEGLEAIACR